MNKLLIPLVALCLAATGWTTTSVLQDAAAPVVQVGDDERLDMQPRIEDLGFLAGLWLGGDGTATWESCYTTGAGGQLVGASKEIRDGTVSMMDFEHFYESEGELRMRPFPFGERSVEFSLVSLDAQERRAVFANLEHDFPKSFIYHRTGEKSLVITLQGDMGGEEAKFVLEFTKQDT